MEKHNQVGTTSQTGFTVTLGNPAVQRPPKIPAITGYETLKLDTFNLKGSFSNIRKPPVTATNQLQQLPQFYAGPNVHSHKNLLKQQKKGGFVVTKVAELNNDWQRIYAHTPLTPSTHQMQTAETQYNFKNQRAFSTNQGFMQARSASLSSKHPSAMNVSENQFSRPSTQAGGKKKKITREERDLQSALLSIQSYGGASREESMYTLMSPTQPPTAHEPRLLQMARGKSKQEFTFGAKKKTHMTVQNSSKNGFFSPTTRDGFSNNLVSDKRIQLKLPKSRSRSPESGDDKAEVMSHQRLVQDLQYNEDLQLQSEMAEHVKVNKLLTLNNYSKMLQNVQRVKKDLYHDHKILQNVKLVSTLQHNMHEEVFKGNGKSNHRVLNEFVNATDKIIKSMIPKEDAWKIKNHVLKNLNVKIHTAELVNTLRTTKSKGSNTRNLNELLSEGANDINSQSISRSCSPASQTRVRSKTMQGKPKITPKASGFNENSLESDTSYMAYVQALTRRANMQHQISQNLIKVKYIKEEDRIKKLREEEVESNKLMSNASIDSLEEIAAIKQEAARDESLNDHAAVFDEEKMIKDFISERDMFIQRYKQKKRMIFNQESSEASKVDILEISQIALKDFIYKNRIRPKIFTFDKSLEDYRPQMNKRVYFLQKSVMLLQTQKLAQARTFLINAVKEFPQDVPLTFNKGLMHFLNGEHVEGARHFYSLLGKIRTRNLLLINLCLCHLNSREFEEVLDLQSEIEKKDNYLDFNEKQLRMMGLFAREKLKAEEPLRYEKYMKIQRDKEVHAQLIDKQAVSRVTTPASQLRPSLRPTGVDREATEVGKIAKRVTTVTAQGHRYDDDDEKEIVILDENKPVGAKQIKASEVTENQQQKESLNNEILTAVFKQSQHLLQDNQRTHTDRNLGMKVQFSQQFSEAFASLNQSGDDESKDLKKMKLAKQKMSMSGVVQDPPKLDITKVYEIDDQADVDSERGEVLTKEDQNILGDVVFLRQDFESDNKLIEYISKIEKRRQGSTKVFLDKRDEFFMKKYKRGVNALVDRNSKYYYKKYLTPEDENDKYTRKVTKIIKPEAKKLLMKSGPELENEEEKLMRLLGMSKDKIDERLLKYKLQSNLREAFTKAEQGTQIQEKAEKVDKPDKLNAEQEKADFPPKTMDFIQYIFREFGLKEVMLPGVENTSIIQDVRNIEQFNAYINRLSEFMTTKTTYFADERQRMQSEDETQIKKAEEKKKKMKGYDSDNEDGIQNIMEDKKDEEDPDKIQGKNMIETFQNVLEIKYIEMYGDQNYEDAAFYQQLLQKLNAIDLLQLFLKNAAKKILGGERLLTFKKELSMGMLQIFREEICKKELNTIKTGDSQYEVQRVSYDMIDRTLRKLRFFKNFAQNIRLRLYEVCRYELIPPGRIIAHQEELDSHIFVIISGIASLTVKYLESNESYSGMLIYPGDAVGDANIRDKIVISKGRGETKWYVSSVKECDVLVFERRQFTDVLFKDMMDSLYEKIMCMRNSEFFENLSPYAMVILCSNIELHEYSYGDVILRQNTEPDECFIIISGECKLVLETVIYKPTEELTAKKGANKMKFGQQNYNPSEKYGNSNYKQKKDRGGDGTAEKVLINQKKLNEKFSFQNEVLDFHMTPDYAPFQDQDGDRCPASPVYSAPVINSTDIPFSEQKQGTKMIAYRHHLPYDKVVAGKVLCSRALLEKEYIKKFINKKYDQFRDQLYGPNHNRSSSASSSNSDRVLSPISRDDHENQLLSCASSLKNGGVSPKNLNVAHDNFLTAEKQFKNIGKMGRKTPASRLSQIKIATTDVKKSVRVTQEEEDKQSEIDKIYQALMKSQLTVIADQAVVKVLKLTRKSKKYLSDPLKAMIDNRIYETKFKDYDRPFKNEVDVQKFIDGQRKWEQYKDKISKNVVQKNVFK